MEGATQGTQDAAVAVPRVPITARPPAARAVAVAVEVAVAVAAAGVQGAAAPCRASTPQKGSLPKRTSTFNSEHNANIASSSRVSAIHPVNPSLPASTLHSV